MTLKDMKDMDYHFSDVFRFVCMYVSLFNMKHMYKYTYLYIYMYLHDTLLTTLI